MSTKASARIIGSFLLLGIVLASLIQPASAASDAYTWALANISGAESQNWRATTSSADGTKLAAAVQPGYIYTSSDSGATWAEQIGSGQRAWAAISGSSDGVKLVAATTDGYIYTSSDSGVTWTERMNVNGTEWVSVRSSSDGVKLVAAATVSDAGNLTPGYIYTSSDSGVTWTQRRSGYWEDVVSSGDGTKLAAVELSANLPASTPGAIYTSSDSGVTWTERTAAGLHYWTAIAGSADGAYLAAVDFAADMAGTPGALYVSSDAGVSWEEQTGYTNYNWQSVSSSSNGSRLVIAATSNYISGVGAVYVGSRNVAAPVTTFDFSGISSTEDATVSHATMSVDSSSACASIDTALSSIVGTEGVTSPDSVSILGGLGFTLNCSVSGSSAEVTITLGTYYDDLSKLRIYKNSNGTLRDITNDVTLSNQVVGGNNVTTIRYTLVDGGEYDSDTTANGVIADPLYVGVASGQTLADTGSDWEMVVYGAIGLIAGSGLAIRRWAR